MGNKPGSKRRRVREYHRAREDQLHAMGMLLGARWTGSYFFQYKMVGENLVHCYYDRDGNEILGELPRLKKRKTKK